MTRVNKVVRSVLVLFLTALPLCLRAIEVRPGWPSVVKITVPEKVSAGETFIARIDLFDEWGNPVSNLSPEMDFYLESDPPLDEVSGSLPGRVFKNGQGNVAFNVTQAGRLQINIRGSDGLTRGWSNMITVLPAEPDRYDVEVAPAELRAGEDLFVKVFALDKFGNIVSRMIDERKIEIRIDTGAGVLLGHISGKRVSKGEGEYFLLTTPGEHRLLVSDNGKPSVKGISSSFQVVPGSVDRIEIIAPPEVEAGKKFSLTLKLLDRFGNIVNKPSIKGRAVHLRRIEDKAGVPEGSMGVFPADIPLERFSDGLLRVDCHVRKSGTFRIGASIDYPSTRATSREIECLPDKPDRIVVDPEKTEVQAGVPFLVDILFEDRFGNRIETERLPDLLKQGEIRFKVFAVDPGHISPGVVHVPAERREKIQTNLLYYGLGEFQIQVAFVSASGRFSVNGYGPPMLSRRGSLAGFTFNTEGEVYADRPVTAVVSARDAAGLLIENYGESAGGVHLERSDGGEISPSFIPASRFARGEARIDIVIPDPGNVEVIVRDPGEGVESRSKTLKVNPSSVERFKVVLPDSVSVGGNIPLKIEALGKNGVLVEKYDRMGREVEIFSLGEGIFIPGLVSSRLFKNGVAKIDARYYVSELTRIGVAERHGAGKGFSSEVRFLPAAPARLELEVENPVVVAGEALKVRYFLLDKYDNLTNSDGEEKTLQIVDEQSGEVIPLSKGGLSLNNGIGQLEASLFRAGDYRLIVRDTTGKIWSDSVEITVEPGEPYRADVSYPDEIYAGRPFTMVIAVLDEYGNPVKKINESSGYVKLVSGESGKLVPAEIPFRTFEGGMFEGKFLTVSTGQFDLKAELVKDVEKGKELNLVRHFPGLNEQGVLLLGNEKIEAFPRTFPDPSIQVVELPGWRLDPALPMEKEFMEGPLARINVQDANNFRKSVRVVLFFREPVEGEWTLRQNSVWYSYKPRLETLPTRRHELPEDTVEYDTGETTLLDQGTEENETDVGQRKVDLNLRFQYIDHLIKFQRLDKAMSEIKLLLEEYPADTEALEYQRRIRNLLFLREED